MRAVRALAFAAALALAAGCDSGSATEAGSTTSALPPEGTTPTPLSNPPRRDCAAWWNTPVNEEDRARLVAKGYRVGGIQKVFASEGRFKEFCIYAFHDESSYVAFRAHWDRKQKRFVSEGITETGSWPPELARNADYSAYLVDGGTVRLDPNWEPSTETEP